MAPTVASMAVTLGALTDDPHRIWHSLRATGPIVWVEALGGWAVIGREAAIEVMRDDETFTVDDPRFSTAQVIGSSMLSTDGAEHERHRGPFGAAFLRREGMQDLEAKTAEAARRLVEGLRPARRAELRTELAGPLAVEVITGALGLVDVDQAAVLVWYRQIVAEVEAISSGETARQGGREAFRDLLAAVDRTIRHLPAGLLGAASRSQSVEEVASNAAVMMFGAIETSEGATANALAHLLSNPELLGSVKDQPDLLASVVEESMRLEPAAASVHRYATRDTEKFGARIRAGDFVDVSLSAANRDPEVFPQPDKLDPGRPNLRRHVTFAHGPHACLGIHLARLETTLGVQAVLEGLPSVTLVNGADVAPRGLVFRKPPAVQVCW